MALTEKQEKKRQYNKTYWEKHKKQIEEKGKEKIECKICGYNYRRRNKSIHDKTKIHLTAVKVRIDILNNIKGV